MDYNFLKLILSIISFSIIFTSHVVPLEYIKLKIGLSNRSKMYSTNKTINTIILGLRKLLNCPSCFSFWLSLILIQDIQLSFIIYIITHLIEKKVNSVNL